MNLAKVYREIVVNHRELDGWSAYRVGYLNEWKFYKDGVYVGTVSVLTSGMTSIKF